MCHSIGRDCRKSRTPLVCFKEMTRNDYAKLKWNCALAKNATTNIRRRITLCSKPWTPFWKLLSDVKARERAFCVFLVPTKKARKGCQAWSGPLSRIPRLSFYVSRSSLWEIERLAKPPVFMYVPSFKKSKKDVMRNENFSPKSRIKAETTLEIKSS